jgi:mannose-1-phosphate guanylyltransferase
MSKLSLVVMAGGSGTRFWPKSTSKRPKQLLSFSSSNKTLLQLTLERFQSLADADRKWIVTTRALASAVKESVPTSVHVLAEPVGRNTAPCVYWAARAVAEKDPRAVMLVMPADHYIADVKAFQATVKKAAEWASSHDDLVTLGIKPTRPETGYGYLRTGKSVEGACLKVEAFVEKPDLTKAKTFLSEGNYLWNGGMFVWRAEVALAAFDKHMPEMKQAWESSGGDVEKAYPHMTATSIDYGVMEKAANVVTFPLECGWDDLGSWTSLESLADALGARSADSVVIGGELLAVESSGNIVDAPGKLVAILGADDLIVVESGGVILVAPKDRAQDIRKLVDAAKQKRADLV